jgi:exopolysaccharide production protein ExoZ
MSSRNDRIPGITALRAFAALSVVVAHALSTGAEIRGTPIEQVLTLPFGAIGVLIFFVISGYVIGLTRHSPTREFAIRRMVRIYPPFWIACFVAFVGIKASGGDAHLDIFDWRMLSLIPTTHINGILGIPYWTLIFEVAFYAAACAVFSLRLNDRTLSLVALVRQCGNEAGTSLRADYRYGLRQLPTHRGSVATMAPAKTGMEASHTPRGAILATA